MTYYMVLIGAQHGDEGKGKMISVFALLADMVARWGGGPNAGHTLVTGGEKYALHLLPSGIIYAQTKNVMGMGMEIDPLVLNDELLRLRQKGFDPELYIAAQAHVITDWQKRFDADSEARLGEAKIGTTGRGVGPCAEAKANRKQAIRIEDLLSGGLEKKCIDIVFSLAPRIVETNPDFRLFLDASLRQILNPQGTLKKALENYALMQAALLAQGGELIRDYIFDDITKIVRDPKNKFVLCEGAQGILLDPDHGSFPYNTSTKPDVSGCISGLGLPYSWIGDVMAVFKAYHTRVGGGPFDTEQDNAIGAEMRERGKEFGTTTGRPRRCGWFDLPDEKKVVERMGVDWASITKLDVLDGMKNVKVCVAKENGKVKYTTLPGWQKDTTQCREYRQLPKNARNYVEYLGKELGVPIAAVSIGPEDDARIFTPKFIRYMKTHNINLARR